MSFSESASFEGARKNTQEAIEDTCLDAYDYELPEEKIAQNPVTPRDSSRLLVVLSRDRHRHCIFHQLPDLLRAGDLLVFNDTRVIPARLYGRKSSGARVEILLLERRGEEKWLALVKPGRRLPVGAIVDFGEGERAFRAIVRERDEKTGGRLLQFYLPEGTSLWEMLERYGEIPFPPYVRDSQASRDRYQTVYADRPGAIAAPTAGLHFTETLLARLDERGIRRAQITLHVGLGTFRPVEANDIARHKMHEEWTCVPAATVDLVRETQARGDRVIAVGTTTARALEGAAIDGTLQPYTGKTDIFIYPGYQWRVVEGLLTNFHLPRSTLLMMIAASIGRKRLLELYREAIATDYRFYSFGDAMLILPEAATFQAAPKQKS